MCTWMKHVSQERSSPDHVVVNGYRSRHDLGRDVIGVNLSGVCHLEWKKTTWSPVAEATASDAKEGAVAAEAE